MVTNLAVTNHSLAEFRIANNPVHLPDFSGSTDMSFVGNMPMAVTGRKKTDVSFPRQETWMTDVEGQQDVVNMTSNSDDLFVIVEWIQLV